MSVNGIWGGCEAALDEAFRVLRPGGLIGISFWGTGPPLDIRELLSRLRRATRPQEHRGSMRQLNNIAAPGVAEEMLTASGFAVLERGGRTSVVEWPDAEIAWRAHLEPRSGRAGAASTTTPTALKREVLDALEPCRDARGIYRFRSDQQFVIARKP